MKSQTVPEIVFDKEKREIRIDGSYAGYIDPSKNLEYKTEVDEHGELTITLTEIFTFETPLPNGATETRIPLMILRPYAHIVDAQAKATRAKVYRAERKAARAEMEALYAKIEAAEEDKLITAVKAGDGQATLGGFF